MIHIHKERSAKQIYQLSGKEPGFFNGLKLVIELTEVLLKLKYMEIF